MKPQTTLFLASAFLFTAFCAPRTEAQEYKLRQSTSVSGMTMESTVYVKGKRKRTESSGYMGMGANQVTIEQCDLQRYIKLNTKKKLYYIEPFGRNEAEVIEEDVKPAVSKKPVTEPKTTKKGGTITMYYSIVDTGERKKMYGLTARHIWTTQKIKPSADACSMKDSMLVKTDGWYIDLPEWNCPQRYGAVADGVGSVPKPDCQDKFVARMSGKGKLGFPLIEKRTMYMNDGPGKTTEFITDLNTIEFTTARLDSMLFTIPAGFTETKNEQDLQDAFDMNAYMEQIRNQDNNNNDNNNNVNPTGVVAGKTAGTLRIGVYVPTGEETLEGNSLQEHLVLSLRNEKVDAVAVTDEDDARSKDCDMTLATQFTRVKQVGKVGGIMKAIKNADPNAASSWNIDADLTLKNLGDGSLRTQQNVSGKYNGQADAAAKLALSEGGAKILRALKQ